MDTPLKQRLIGAVVLIALAVIFLPMLVKGPAPDSGVSDVPLDVPAAPGGQYETRELPLVAPGQPSESGALGMPVATAPNPDAAAPAEDTPVGETTPATAAGNYAVSFGAYASAKDADAVIARLRQSQLPGYHEETTINGRNAWRVRVGPYLDRAAAESARLQAVKVRNDVNAQVVVLDADAASASATAAVAPSTPPAPASSVTTQPLPSASTAAATATELPPTPAPPAKATAAPAPAATGQAAPTVTSPAPTPPASPAPQPATPPAATSVPATAPDSAPAAGGVGYAVQLGAFVNAADANALRDRVRAGGFSAFVEQVRTDKGMLNRVRVGPVASRAEAERLKSQVAGRYGIDGMVRPHP